MFPSIFFLANVAAALAGIGYFALYAPYFALETKYTTMSRSEKFAASLIFNQAMAFGARIITMWEGTGNQICIMS